MPITGYFEIPADNVGRVRAVYRSYLARRIELIEGKDPEAVVATQYSPITTGEPREGPFTMGGLYRRPTTEGVVHVMVDDLDAVLADVERLGGKVIMPRMEIPSAGPDAIIPDTGGTASGSGSGKRSDLPLTP
jgi:uncharacterized protein